MTKPRRPVSAGAGARSRPSSVQEQDEVLDAVAASAPARNKGGRPRAHEHIPTDVTRGQVEAMASYGIAQEDICKVVGVSVPTLRKHYAAQIEVAAIKANSVVAQRLFEKTKGDGSSAVTACIFWLKTRAGWKDQPQQFEHTGAGGGPMTFRNLESLSDAELELFEKIMAKLASAERGAVDAPIGRIGGRSG